MKPNFEELDRNDDDDILLFQYGIYDWEKGRFFGGRFHTPIL